MIDYLNEITTAIKNHKICPIHGMPIYLWRDNKFKKLSQKLLPHIRSTKGKYFFLAYMAALTETQAEEKLAKHKAYKAVKKLNRLYPPPYTVTLHLAHSI